MTKPKTSKSKARTIPRKQWQEMYDSIIADLKNHGKFLFHDKTEYTDVEIVDEILYFLDRCSKNTKIN